MIDVLFNNSYWFGFKQLLLKISVISYKPMLSVCNSVGRNNVLSDNLCIALLLPLPQLETQKKPTWTNCCGYLLFQLKPKHFRRQFIWSCCNIHVQCKKEAGVWNRDDFVLFPTSQLFVTKTNFVTQGNVSENIQRAILGLITGSASCFPSDSLSSAEETSIPKLHTCVCGKTVLLRS